MATIVHVLSLPCPHCGGDVPVPPLRDYADSAGSELPAALRDVKGLTRTEVALLEGLWIVHPGWSSRDRLLTLVWGADYTLEHHILHVALSRLRRRIRGTCWRIENNPAFGYRLVEVPA